MADRDARSLAQAAQEELRRRAVALVAGGRSQVQVAGLLGVARQAVGRWVKAHREGGEQALAAGKRGRRLGEKTALEPWQQAQIAKAIREKNPDQLKLPGFLWTRALVCDLIETRFRIRIAEKTAGRYLRRWGFSPQEPVRRAYEQSGPKVRAWLDEVYPQIERNARRDGAEILWGDEMGMRSDHTSGTSWSPVGKTPVVRGTGKRFKTNMIAVISNTGTLRFRVFQERFTGRVFLDFIKRLVKDAKGRKVVLIVDGHPAHHAKIVRQWVTDRPELIELHFLPGYTPELNPTECLNQDVKANALGRRRPRDLAQLAGEVRAYLRSRQRQPWRVANYFQERPVTYAAARPLFTRPA